MGQSFTRRTRNHRSSRATRPEGAFFRKESKEPAFFDTAAPTPFFSASNAEVVHRKCDECEKQDKDKRVQRKEAGASNAPASAAAAIPGSGRPLPATLHDYFSSRMGYDFSDAKIHTGSEAARSAKSINAKAYTLGTNIVFGEGQYQPDTYEGRKLLAHELAHVVQQDSGHLNRKAAEDDAPETDGAEDEALPPISIYGAGTSTSNKTAFGNCQGVHVAGSTDANYDHGNYSVSGATVKRATNCAGCTGDDCVTVSGKIESVFQANPTVTLPGVPSGLNACERKAVQNFIDTTLSQHEQLHVAAFNTYNATIKTPFTYKGCKDGLDSHVADIHDGIEASRTASANAKSAALDANGANNFTITCNCPDTKP